MQVGVAVHYPHQVNNRPVLFQKNSISTLLRTTLLEIILIRFTALEPPIRIWQNQYILLSHIQSIFVLYPRFLCIVQVGTPEAQVLIQVHWQEKHCKTTCQIEHHQAHLWWINTKLPNSYWSHQSWLCKVTQKPISPQVHHHIALYESVHKDIGTFLHQHSDDPAVKVCAHIIQKSSLGSHNTRISYQT